MKNKILGLGVFFFAVLILAFQNCARISQPMDFAQSGSKVASDSGNGQGYDGKIFIVAGTCPDQSQIKAKIVLRSSTTGELVRENCEDIAPVDLAANTLQINPNNADELFYSNRTFIAQIPSSAVSLNLAKASFSAGFRYELYHSFGTAADTPADLTISKVQIFENGLPLGPAHAVHADIANLGQGRFSHWIDNTGEFIYFSASDNSNPLTNGRVYSYRLQ